MYPQAILGFPTLQIVDKTDVRFQEPVGSAGPSLEASSLLSVSSSSSATLVLGLEDQGGDGAGAADEISGSQGNTAGGGQPERLFPRKDRPGGLGLWNSHSPQLVPLSFFIISEMGLFTSLDCYGGKRDDLHTWLCFKSVKR